MKLLLDTHTYIWWDSEPDRISRRASALCKDPENTLLLSVVSVWEIQIKMQLGKLKLGLPLAESIASQQRINNLEIIPIRLEHVMALDKLAPHHKDPFDRLLVAQAGLERAFLVSKDPIFSRYPVNVVW